MGGSEGLGEVGLVRNMRSPFIISRPENIAWRARPRVATTVLREIQDSVYRLPETSHLQPQKQSYTPRNLCLGFKQECPIAQLWGAPFAESAMCMMPWELGNSDVPKLLPSG